MAADRPGDPGLPPDEQPDRRDGRDSGGGPAARAGEARAETRTRQEYYSELRATVARQEPAGARQAAAGERAASQKWQQTEAESRWLWGEYQRKWPPAERPAIDRSGDPAGSWRVDGKGLLEPAENSRVDAECDRIARREEERISPALRAIESQDPGRHLAGFEHRRKEHDRIKEKVYRTIKDFSRSPEQAVSLVPDTIRYTFQYRESRYTQGVWADMGRLQEKGFELRKLKNYWSDDQYKGINSTWVEPGTGQRFEVQFHTRISFEAKQLTHPAYERIRTKQPDKLEQMVLEAFQRKVTGEVPVPPGAADVPDYP